MSKTMTSETTTRTIGECFPYIKNGANIKQDKEGDGFPVTRIETISGGGFHRDRMGYANIHDAEKYKNWVLHDGDILMSHINSIPNLGRAVEYKAEEGETIIHGMNLLALRADRTIVIPGYADIYFSSTVFRNYVFRITKKAVNQASFSIKDLKTVPIPLPSLETQKAIAQQFAQINTLHQELLQKIDCLDAVIKSRFIEMFGDPSLMDGRWRMARLDSFTQVITGNTPSRKKPEYYGEGIEWVKTDNIANSIVTTAAEQLTAVGQEKARVAPADSILMACIAGSVKSIGRVGLLDRKVAFNQQINAIVPKENVDSRFLLVLLTLSKKYLCSSINMQLKGILNKSSLSAKEFPLPPLELQQEFAAFVVHVDKLRFAAQQQIDKLQMLKKSLLQEYFN